mmetsp:Transcript_2875/g.10216  ORF Transcript_2875/g.10216 Transcript_2875/m.10216 type:complete len:149 (+) Transcript_2875:260-706(+)
MAAAVAVLCAMVLLGASPAAAVLVDADTFEDASEVWESRENKGTPAHDCTTAYSGSCSMFFRTANGRNFEGNVHTDNDGDNSVLPWVLADAPIMCFAYRIPAQVTDDTNGNSVAEQGPIRYHLDWQQITTDAASTQYGASQTSTAATR